MEEKNTDNKRTREIKGVVCLALAVFALLCLVSYDPQDPSFTRFVVDGKATHNFTGYIGSYTADSLIRLLGFSSFLLPLILLLCSFKYFLRPSFAIKSGRLFGFFFFVLAFAGLMAIILNDGITIYGETLQAGGIIGALIVRLLLYCFNVAGTYIILIFVFIVTLISLVEFSLVSVAQRVSQSALKIITFGNKRLFDFVNLAFKNIKIERQPQPVFEENSFGNKKTKTQKN